VILRHIIIILGINLMSNSSLNNSLILQKQKTKVQLARMPLIIDSLTSSFIGCLLVL
jgi:hypothetical protein